MKYIDAEKLVTIIEERKAQQDQWVNRYHDAINQGISNELTEILDIIYSLQQEQPEVDLEKEIKDTCRGYRINDYHEQELGKQDIENLARHFYELGLNARKEE